MANVNVVDKPLALAGKPQARPVVPPEAQPRLPGDSLQIKSKKPATWDPVGTIRKGVLEAAGGAVLTVGGVVGVALTVGAAPVAVPIALGVVAVGGVALTAKGVSDYALGSVELVIDILTLPFRLFQGNQTEQK